MQTALSSFGTRAPGSWQLGLMLTVSDVMLYHGTLPTRTCSPRVVMMGKSKCAYFHPPPDLRQCIPNEI